jgi:hypothetical protein
MHEPRNVPDLSATDAEAHQRTTGTVNNHHYKVDFDWDDKTNWVKANPCLSTVVKPDDLSQGESPEPHMEPLGIDMPGVGCVPPARNVAPPMATGPRPDPPPSLRRMLHETLCDELASAAIDLAGRNIVLRNRFLNRISKECRECGRSEALSGELSHAAWCKTGRVLALATEIALDGPVPSNTETKKETTATSGESRAGDGEASRRPMTMDEVLSEQKKACEGQGEAEPESVGEYGEPWRLQGYRNDPMRGASAYIQIEQGNTGQVLEVKGPHVLDAANRMIACINASVGISDEVLAKVLTGNYFLVRTKDAQRFADFSNAWLAHEGAQAQEGGAR